MNKNGIPHGNTTHGMCFQAEYYPWRAMIKRCYRRDNPNYHRYGGRGITVCALWRKSIHNFVADMGRRPSAKHSIERKNNDGNYTPKNCYWATKDQQNSNRGDNHFVVYGGLKMTLSQAIRAAGIVSIPTGFGRVRRGWPIPLAFTCPPLKPNQPRPSL